MWRSNRHHRWQLCPCRNVVSNWNSITISQRNVHRIYDRLCGKHCHWFHWHGGEFQLTSNDFIFFSFFFWLFVGEIRPISLYCFGFDVMRLGSFVSVTWPTRHELRDRQCMRSAENSIDKTHVASVGQRINRKKKMNLFFVSSKLYFYFGFIKWKQRARDRIEFKFSVYD